MGLDTVEFMMEIEDRFSIRISQADAANIQTVGDLARHILDNVEEERNETLDLDAVIRLITDLLAENYGVDRKAITAEASLVQDLKLD